MTKKNKYKRNYLNYFDDGGKLGNILIGTGMGAAGNIGGNLISDGKSSGVGNTIGSLGNTIGGAAMAVNPIVGGAIMAGSKVLGGITNALFGSKLNNERIALALNEINNALSFTGNASNFDDLSLLIATLPMIAGFNKKDIGSDGLFSNKAKKKYKSLLALKQQAEDWVDRAITNSAANLQLNQIGNLLLNYAAYGGLLDVNNSYSDGGSIYIKPENRGKFTALKERTGKSATWFKEHGTPVLKKMATFALNARKWKHEDGGILDNNINTNSTQLNYKGNRILGFNSNYYALGGTPSYYYLKDNNLFSLALENPILNSTKFSYISDNNINNNTNNRNNNNLNFIGDMLWNEDYNINRKNKKAFGGDLITNGGVFSNNVTTIGNGGTHELSPYEGVLLGVDNLGIPNLVEENEVIWNDYVFSDRIKVPKTVKEKLKLRGNKDMTFADAANKILKITEERPNDPIAMETMNINLSRLALEQEAIRQQRQLGQEGRKYKSGGTKVSKKQVGLNAWDAYNQMLTNPYNEATTGFGEGLDIDSKTAVLREKNILNSKVSTNPSGNYATWLRYAPVVGSAIGLGLTLLSSPDYSRADALALYALNAGKITPITYNPLGNYLTYNPVDIDYLANRAAALAGATRRNIMNTTGGNRAAAIGSLLAADYNTLLALGELLRQAEEANINRRAQVESFNRATNQANSEMALKVAMANQEARLRASQMGLSGYTAAMLMKDAIDALRNASINANMTALFDSLGDIGREEMAKRMVNESPALLYDYLNRYKGSKSSNKSAKGGKINRKKRGGFTY